MSAKKQLPKKMGMSKHRLIRRILSILVLFASIVITLSIILFPQVLSGKSGKPDHMAALFLFWTMSAGYIWGIGYQPQKKLFYWMFSPWAFVLTFLMAFIRLM